MIKLRYRTNTSTHSRQITTAVERRKSPNRYHGLCACGCICVKGDAVCASQDIAALEHDQHTLEALHGHDRCEQPEREGMAVISIVQQAEEEAC